MTTLAPTARLDPAERRSLLGMGAVIFGLHVVGLGVLLGLVVPGHYQLGGSTPVFGAGVGVLTKVADSPGLGAVDRVTQSFYDWRDRTVAVKALV